MQGGFFLCDGLTEVRPYGIGAEVNVRQVTVVLRHKVDDPDDREHSRHPALTARIEVTQRSGITQDEDGEREENDVLEEALQVGQLDRITEATAVGDGVSDKRCRASRPSSAA